MSVTCVVREYKTLQKRVKKLETVSETVMKRTVSDMKSRTPGWVAREVMEVYGVPKSEFSKGRLGTIQVAGGSTGRVEVRYKGHVLTPAHFSMPPKAPPVGRAYTLKYRVVDSTVSKVKKLTKKQRKNLRKGVNTSNHSPIMLMHAGNTKTGGMDYIPFQRKSTNRKDIQAIKTVSLPQMVSSERTQPAIGKAINEGLEKRFQHHMKLLDKV